MSKKFVILFLGLTACNYDAGECYLRAEAGDGAGGNIISVTGAGGFGDVPPEPQDATDPVNPCSTQTAECTVTWKADSAVCKDRGTSGNCTTLFQCQHATLAEAKERCEHDYGVQIGSGALSCGPCQWVTSTADEKCKAACEKVYNKCMDKCKDNDCRNECFSDYVECLRECDK